MRKVMIKIVTAVVLFVALVGVTIYEGWSIVTKEYERQSGIAAEATEEIELGLNMVKIAVQTEDVDLYTANLARVRGEMAEISELGMMKDEYGEYLGALGEYVGLLEGKVELLAEMRSVRGAVGETMEALKSEYGNKDEISREKVKGAKGKIGGLLVDTTEYKVEQVRAVVETVNGVLDKMAGKAGELADCIDSCYKDKIRGLNDELAKVFKDLIDKAPEVNKRLVGEFELEKMEKLRK